jgi:uncharacterized membrane protein YdjX (TVP38/TMEM64 family)
VPLGAIALLVSLYFAVPGFRAFVEEGWEVVRSGDRERVSSWVRSLGAMGPVAIYGLAIAQTVLFAVPSLLVTVAAVLAYGPFLGALLAWSALLLSATVAYWVGRALGPVTVGRLIGEKKERTVRGWVESYGFWGIVAARVSPAMSSDALSLVAGLACMRYLKFLLATAVGTAPLVVLVAFLGQDMDRLKTGLIWVGVASVALFAAWVVYDRKLRRANAPARRSVHGGR